MSVEADSLGMEGDNDTWKETPKNHLMKERTDSLNLEAGRVSMTSTHFSKVNFFSHHLFLPIILSFSI